jgi:O-antigen ligase
MTLGMYKLGPLVVAALVVAALIGIVVLEQPMFGVVAALLAIPLEHSSVKLGGGGLSPTETLFIVTAAAVLLRTVASDGRQELPTPYAFLVGLLGVMLLGASYATNSGIVLHVVLMWSAFVVVSLLVATAPATRVELALGALVVAAGVVGVIAIASTGTQELVQGGQNAVGRAHGVFGHANFLADFMILALPQAIVMVARGPAVRRVIAIVAIPLIVAGLMLSLSRTGIVGALCALAVMLAWRDFRRAVVVLLVLVAAFGVLNSGAISRSKEVSIVSQRLSTAGGGSSIQRDPRPDIWRATPGIIAEDPLFGVGAKNFQYASRRRGLIGVDGGSYVHAHNTILTFAAEFGLVGLALFLGFVVTLIRMVAPGWRRDGPYRAWVVSLSASLIGLSIASLGDYPPDNNAIWASTLVVAGALIALARHNERSAAGSLPESRPAPRRSRAPAVIPEPRHAASRP